MKHYKDVLMRLSAGLAWVGMAGALGACVQVNAPNEPIVINLNINIRQEIVYRLDSSARELIEQEAEIF